MTPDLALILSFEGIALLERADDGWHSLGEADPADPDLARTLARLRGRARTSAPYPTKLILPAEQIRFLQHGGALSHEDVRAALEGATPYPVEDLIFDWLTCGGETFVAATARQTIREAEEFALSQGFLPVSVVGAVPEDAHDWEPFFGALSGARADEDEDGDAVVAADGLEELSQAGLEAPQPPEPEQSAADEAPGADEPEILRDGSAPEEDADPQDGAALQQDQEPTALPEDPDDVSATETGTSDGPALVVDDESIADPDRTAADPVAPQDPEPEGAGDTVLPIALTNPVATSSQRVDDADDEARRLTIFGARPPSGSAPAQRRAPRAPLLLIAALAILGVAGATVFATGAGTPLLSRIWPAPPAAEIIETALDTTPEESPADPAAAPAPATQPDELQLTEDSPAAPEIDLEALEASYAATGIWPAAPAPLAAPDAPDQADIHLAAIDPRTVIGDAIALPDAGSLAADDPAAVLIDPAPADTVFDLGPDGRVRPTPDGALTPDGIMVHLGPPPRRPPPTPDRPDEEALRAETSAALQQALLAAVRPLVRPETLVEENERAQFGGRSREELAGIRPLLRPRSLQDEAAANAPANAPPSAHAITLSPKPRARPDGFAAVVARAQPAPQAPQAPAVSAAAAIRATAPSGASVARQATTDNVLRLNQVNLIGVYGVPSNRRALIRLSNGRYVKVEVGDTLDGGRVAAIGDGELRYVKKGRNVVLRMPKG